MDLLKLWKKTHRLPAGRFIFSKIVGQVVPYTGTLGATVMELDSGYSKIQLNDRRGVRNHLQSIHAVALMNLGEFSSGLALVSGLPPSMRAILVKFQIEFIKKARGTLTAETRCEIPTSPESREMTLTCPIKDASGETVAVVQALWKVGAKK